VECANQLNWIATKKAKSNWVKINASSAHHVKKEKSFVITLVLSKIDQDVIAISNMMLKPIPVKSVKLTLHQVTVISSKTVNVLQWTVSRKACSN